MIKAIVFDFDGLILDTEYAEFTAWQELYKELSFEMKLEDWIQVIGTGSTTIEWSPYKDLEQKLGSEYNEEVIRARRREIFSVLIEREKIMPGVANLITEAETAGLKLAVASSSPRTWVEGYLAQLGLRHHFEAVKTETDVKFAKPNPELYLSAMDALGVEAHESIALEDSANGTKAAIAAGMFCVTVPNRLTKHTDLSHSSLIVDSLAHVSLVELCADADAFYESFSPKH